MMSNRYRMISLILFGSAFPTMIILLYLLIPLLGSMAYLIATADATLTLGMGFYFWNQSNR